MALPDVHMKPTVPTPAESVCGCVCPMTSCFQNAQFNIEKKLLCQTLPPMKWLTKPHSTQVTTMTFSKCGGLQSCVQSVEWKNVPLCTSLPEEKLWKRQEAGEPFGCQLCSECAHLLPQNLVGFKKKKQATVLVNCNFWLHHDGSFSLLCQLQLCNRQTRHWSLDAGNGTSQWNGHRRQKQSFKRQ